MTPAPSSCRTAATARSAGPPLSAWRRRPAADTWANDNGGDAMVKPIPDGFHSLSPHLTVADAAAAIEFYKKAFGATEMGRMPAPDGKRVMHAMLRIGDSSLMLNDEFPEWSVERGPKSLGGTAVTIHLYVEDCDAVYK